jgi:hypothetical protein
MNFFSNSCFFLRVLMSVAFLYGGHTFGLSYNLKKKKEELSPILAFYHANHDYMAENLHIQDEKTARAFALQTHNSLGIAPLTNTSSQRLMEERPNTKKDILSLHYNANKRVFIVRQIFETLFTSDFGSQKFYVPLIRENEGTFLELLGDKFSIHLKPMGEIFWESEASYLNTVDFISHSNETLIFDSWKSFLTYNKALKEEGITLGSKFVVIKNSFLKRLIYDFLPPELEFFFHQTFVKALEAFLTPTNEFHFSAKYDMPQESEGEGINLKDLAQHLRQHILKKNDKGQTIRLSNPEEWGLFKLNLPNEKFIDL